MIDVGPGPTTSGTRWQSRVSASSATSSRTRNRALGAGRPRNQRDTLRDVARSPGVRLPLHGFAGTIGVELGRHEIETAFDREEELRAKQDSCCLRNRPTRCRPASAAQRRARDAACAPFPARERREHRREADGERNDAAVPLLHRRLRALGGRRALGAGRRRGFRHRHRDERDRHGEGRGPQNLAAAFGNWPRFESNRAGVLKELEPDHFVATMGIPVKPSGVVMAPELWIDVNSNHLLRPLRNESEDVTLAARDALLKMIDLLTGPTSPAPSKLTAEQAYLLCSVACDLRISNLVDVPNYVVSNFLQLDVFNAGPKHDERPQALTLSLLGVAAALLPATPRTPVVRLSGKAPGRGDRRGATGAFALATVVASAIAARWPETKAVPAAARTPAEVVKLLSSGQLQVGLLPPAEASRRSRGAAGSPAMARCRCARWRSSAGDLLVSRNLRPGARACHRAGPGRMSREGAARGEAFLRGPASIPFHPARSTITRAGRPGPNGSRLGACARGRSGSSSTPTTWDTTRRSTAASSRRTRAGW